MKSPYGNQYGSDLLKTQVKGPSNRERAQAGAASRNANLLRLLSSAAPAVGSIAGTAIGAGIGSMAGGVGAVPGAAIGGALGGGAGQMLGALGGEGAAQMTQPFEEADLDRRAKLEMYQRILGGM